MKVCVFVRGERKRQRNNMFERERERERERELFVKKGSVCEI